ncbi:hypothetical protein IQ16_08196 [Bradyrhizobium huanghuaihaiense]|uniref:Uncharacterized protein n=1 Tax=Bradyrhizobium huanghuaihaiense TaxID=990078 RepID=A0A562QQ10_9BRAD|nr:hypothetical protein [Bradyrhizobium huanghuaihaiense]TWI58290.1 hypothetical protein IQ16_08196 [Bradyrhizobium huanghuaihaiense]
MKSEVFDRDGKRITLAGNVVPDGATVRVAQMIMDAAPAGLHRPGSLPLADVDRDARQAAYEDRKRSLSDRWRHPAPAQPPAGAKAPQTTPPAPVAGVSDAEARYAERCAAVEQAWRRA